MTQSVEQFTAPGKFAINEFFENVEELMKKRDITGAQRLYYFIKYGNDPHLVNAQAHYIKNLTKNHQKI
jgi:hypothetical protein